MVLCAFALAGPTATPEMSAPTSWIQGRLFEARRDFTRFDEDADADLGRSWHHEGKSWYEAAHPARVLTQSRSGGFPVLGTRRAECVASSEMT
jgi:hypothetical protein